MTDKSQTADLAARLRAIAAEWDDPMCSENPVHPLLLEAADEIDALMRVVRDHRRIIGKNPPTSTPGDPLHVDFGR